MKTKEIIRGKIFIIPNGLYCPDELDYNGGFILDSLREYSQATQQKWFYSHNEEWRKEHEDIRKSNRQKYVQVWFFEPTGENDDSNWFDHGIDGYDELKNWRPLTNLLPVEMFRGYKEGDTVTFELPIEKDLYKEAIRERRQWAMEFEEMYLRKPTDDEIQEQCPIDYDIDGTRVITWIKVSVILSQKDGRYSSFGGFHEVLTDKGAWTPCSVPSYSDCKQRIHDLQNSIENRC
jgi:hypothetical protein